MLSHDLLAHGLEEQVLYAQAVRLGPVDSTRGSVSAKPGSYLYAPLIVLQFA
jgi:hypothetical protein